MVPMMVAGTEAFRRRAQARSASGGAAVNVLAGVGVPAQILLRNTGSHTAWLGGADVSAAQGLPLKAGEILSARAKGQALYAIAPTGATTLRLLWDELNLETPPAVSGSGQAELETLAAAAVTTVGLLYLMGADLDYLPEQRTRVSVEPLHPFTFPETITGVNHSADTCKAITLGKAVDFSCYAGVNYAWANNTSPGLYGAAGAGMYLAPGAHSIECPAVNANYLCFSRTTGKAGDTWCKLRYLDFYPGCAT